MKIHKKTKQITSPFAGISFIDKSFTKSGLVELIDNELGCRVQTVGYSYSDIIKNFFHIFFCGGDCAEDIQTHFKENLSSIPDNKVPSADTILRGIKELTTDNTKFTSNDGNVYNFNINLKLNRLNIKSLLLTGQLQSGNYYDFDYDNQVIKNSKYDAKTSYKKVKAYVPAVGSIGENIVCVENRDGNANVKIGQAETLKRAYNLLREQGIYINRSRMDAGSYSKDIIDVVSQNSKLFYIRANKSNRVFEQLSEINDWEKVEINYCNYEVCSVKFDNFYQERGYRLVAMRERIDTNELDLFTHGKFKYRVILTNDWDSTEVEIIKYYNQRGTSEKLFDVMNNDFGWKNMPFSFLNENCSFLILMAMCKNYYNHFVSIVSNVFDDIEPNTRLKRFIFRFISVAGQWIYKGRQWILRLFTNRPYEKLNF